jgi:pimeloyl-ACP methyl ester carboxylesterase
MKTAAGKHALIHSARQIMPSDAAQIAARYSTIALPRLILWCDPDRIVPVEIGALRARSAKISNANFRVIDQCGHVPQEEQPEATHAANPPIPGHAAR